MLHVKNEVKISGWVNFPVNDPDWENTGDGGMLVKLVVCDDRKLDEQQFRMCFGAHVVDIMGLYLVGDDHAPEFSSSVEEYHFPSLNDRMANGLHRFVSREYLANIILGATSWSGWNESEDRYWACKFDDLTEEGKALYKQIEALYPGCKLHLLTFLDA